MFFELQFMVKLTTAMVRSLYEIFSSNNSNEKFSLTRPQQYVAWCAASDKLVASFSINADTIRRHHVTELYSSGLDHLAREVFTE